MKRNIFIILISFFSTFLFGCKNSEKNIFTLYKIHTLSVQRLHNKKFTGKKRKEPTMRQAPFLNLFCTS